MSAFWDRIRERLADVAASCICVTSAFATIHIAYLAPQYAAILIGAALIALAIYKRPGSTVTSTFNIEGDMPVDALTANVDARIIKAIVDAVRAERSEPAA